MPGRCWGSGRVSVLSDEPCWGQSSALAAAVRATYVSVLSDEPCWGQYNYIIPDESIEERFSALGRAVLGSMNGPRRAQRGGRVFQCSRTSRVGVNDAAARAMARRAVVSVLSDEPCWGQWNLIIPEEPTDERFSALGRAVLGSMRWATTWRSATAGFQCSRTSRVGVNRRA